MENVAVICSVLNLTLILLIMTDNLSCWMLQISSSLAFFSRSDLRIIT